MNLLLNSGIEVSTSTLRPADAPNSQSDPIDYAALVDIATRSRTATVWISGTGQSIVSDSTVGDGTVGDGHGGCGSFDPAVIAGALVAVDSTSNYGIVGQLCEWAHSDYLGEPDYSPGERQPSAGQRHPGLFARDVAALDLLSSTRVELLLCCEPLRAAGVSNDFGRAHRLCEAAHICSLLLSGQSSTFAGNYYSVERAVNNPALNHPSRECLAVDLGSVYEGQLAAGQKGCREMIEFVVEEVAGEVGLMLGSGDADLAGFVVETLDTNSDKGGENQPPSLAWRVDWRGVDRDELRSTLANLVDSGVRGFVFLVDRIDHSTRDDISLLGSLIASVEDRFG